MSNQGHPSTYRLDLPVHVFSNFGVRDNVISVKQFATTREARAWVEQLEKERPGYYCIIDKNEIDPFA